MTETADTVGHRARFDSVGYERPSTAIVQAIASATDRSPLEVDSLYGVLDFESLDRLFERSSAEPLSVEFVHEERAVRISGEGWVEVRELEDDPDV